MRRDCAALLCAGVLLLSGCSSPIQPSRPADTETPQVFTLELGTETNETATPSNDSTTTERASPEATASDDGSVMSETPIGTAETGDDDA